MSRVLTGDRPTGALHLGHLFGTLANRVRLQRAGHEVFIVVADYQVITDRDRPEDLRRTVLDLVLDYLASGLDPQDTVIFAHSSVPELHQLMLPFLSLVTDAELRRNPTVKDEIASSRQRQVNGLLLTYPVHQAADVLFCRADLVPVGRDQLPHLEVTRRVARRFNERYAPVFALPEAVLGEAPLLGGLDGQKMSKSRGNGIALRAGDEEIRAAVRAARTDSERHITYEPQRRPEVARLLELAALCGAEEPATLAQRLGGAGAAALKETLTDAIIAILAPMRQRRAGLDHAEAAALLARGTARARAEAVDTLDRVRAAMGMNYAA